jgi:SAM-dependent methyltransferase
MTLFGKRILRAVHRTVGPALPPTLLAKHYAGIPGRIHVDDQMLASDAADRVRHYLDDACDALANLEASLIACGMRWNEVTSCLDLPSGYGRVTRWLAQRLPPHAITAADVDRQAVRFCAAEFGVRPLVAPRDVRALRLPPVYDLVFTGSLLTHLPAAHGLLLVAALVRGLAPGGVLVLTTQGASCLRHLDIYGAHFARAECHYRDGLAVEGVAYLDYPGRRGYGVTLHAESAFRQALLDGFGATVTLARFAPRGWDRHQDVWTLQRRSEARPDAPIAGHRS